MPPKQVQSLSRRRIPEEHRPGMAGRGNTLAVQRISDGANRLSMAVVIGVLAAVGRVPETDQTIAAAGNQRPAVGREGQGTNVLAVAAKPAEELSGRRVV